MRGRTLLLVGTIATLLLLGVSVGLFSLTRDPMVLLFGPQLAVVGWIAIGIVAAVRATPPPSTGGRQLALVGGAATLLVIAAFLPLFYATRDLMTLVIGVQLAVLAWIVVGITWALRLARRRGAPQ